MPATRIVPFGLMSCSPLRRCVPSLLYRNPANLYRTDPTSLLFLSACAGVGFRARSRSCLPRAIFPTKAQPMLRRLLRVENSAAVLAHRHSLLHLFAARRTIVHPHRNVSPFAFDAQADRRPPVQIRNFAERMPARPHRVAFSDQPVVERIPPLARRTQFLSRRPRPGANEHTVVLKVLQQIHGNLARRNRKRKSPVVSQ